ncbi:MAG TPA: 8-oxoguanine deaminase [Kiritimatiellia bacterium]|nr:8-oxoguanine deaminase [Kiritimatiellia bacterium]
MNVLIRQIHTLVTMNAGGEILHGVDVRVREGWITEVGKGLVPVPEVERVIDGSWCVAFPGFVNTHHHLYQTLTRNLPGLQNVKLFDWLIGLYEIWRGLGEEAVDVSTRVGVGELLLSGCTCTTDHFYVFPKGASRQLIDVEVAAAREMGIRFHPTRGSMSRGRSAGGLPPDDVVQGAEEILEDCRRVVEAYHDASPGSMCRIALAPCSPFSVTDELLKETLELARSLGVRCHTHLCETLDEEAFCLETHGRRPMDYMEDLGWLGEDVWFAHVVYVNDEEIRRLATTRTGVAHCPISNLRLGSGIARIPAMLKAGVRVGMAVDGSASNDASNLLRDMQAALLVHRVGTGVEAMPPGPVLTMATRHGADILGFPEAGCVEPGRVGDLALFRLDRIDYAGAMADPAHAVLFCGGAPRAEYTIVHGEVRVEKGRLTGVDEEALFHRANDVAADLLKKAEENR